MGFNFGCLAVAVKSPSQSLSNMELASLSDKAVSSQREKHAGRSAGLDKQNVLMVLRDCGLFGAV